MNLRNWLKKTPRPVAVLADEKRIEVPRNTRAINDLLATIEAMEPSKLTCLDANGNVIRSINLDADEPAAANGGAAAGAVVSPEMTDLQYFARLLADAYENGRKGNQPLFDQAMTFVERNSERLAAADREIERLRSHNARLHQQVLELSIVPAPEALPAESDSILSAMLAGAVQRGLGGASPTPPPTPIKQPATATGAKK